MMNSFSLPPICTEEPLCIDGIPLFTLSHQLPQLSREGRFNRYYSACRSAFLRTCREDLAPMLQAAYRRSLESAAPLPQWQGRLIAAVTYRDGQLLSLRTDALIVGPEERWHLRRGDTWDLQHQLPLPLSLFFPAGTNLRRRLCDAAAQEIARQEADGLARYYPGWERMLPRAFRSQRFFLSEEGLHFFFPLHAIAPAMEGCPTFFMPYDREKGPFPAERPKSFPEGCPK